jgi:Ribonuclease G/E
MAKEICISSTPHETRLAILEDDQLAEIYYERENEYTLAGSIYNGRVTRVLPGMQSAFVDVGLERDAFLYVTDFLELEDRKRPTSWKRPRRSGGNQPPREVRPDPEPGEAVAARSRSRLLTPKLPPTVRKIPERPARSAGADAVVAVAAVAGLVRPRVSLKAVRLPRPTSRRSPKPKHRLRRRFRQGNSS